nr:hypothetical protein [Streptomyces sp. ISL-94]
MNTFLDYAVVFVIAALLLGPSLWGAARDRRVDRQLRAAQQREQVVRKGHRREEARTRTPRVAVRHAPGH